MGTLPKGILHPEGVEKMPQEAQVHTGELSWTWGGGPMLMSTMVLPCQSTEPNTLGTVPCRALLCDKTVPCRALLCDKRKRARLSVSRASLASSDVAILA